MLRFSCTSGTESKSGSTTWWTHPPIGGPGRDCSPSNPPGLLAYRHGSPPPLGVVGGSPQFCHRVTSSCSHSHHRTVRVSRVRSAYATSEPVSGSASAGGCSGGASPFSAATLLPFSSRSGFLVVE